ncbi:MAG TPA: NAD(P)-dependent oxidoreductase [Bryobacteraceae bacterium]|nr:NAD(P)-dependent oxidoreductase [Bryobacteraceae bacterium]
MNVGFIGLGRMGQGMARRILSGGCRLAVYDIVPSQLAGLVAEGAIAAASVAEVCQARDVVVTMLVEDQAVIDVATRPGGICDSLPPGSIHLAMGTYGVGAVRTLAAAHAGARQFLVVAPVLGRPDLAASGQLGIVAAGPDEAVRRCEPLFQRIGRRAFLAGPQPEAATVVKLANNLVLGSAMIAMAEGFSLVRKYGVDPQVLYQVMTEGLFSAPAYKGYGKTMVEQTFEPPGSPITVGLKDANLIQAAADLARVPLPGFNVYRDRLLGAVAHGDGDKDQAALAREQARACGLE